MLNTSKIKLGSNSQTISLNTPSTGILQRSHSKSVFIRFQKGSQIEDRIFPGDGSSAYIYKKTDHSFRVASDKINVVVLQILIFGNDQFLCEIVNESYLTEC